jgi:DNA-binding transcriptional MerR regulator
VVKWSKIGAKVAMWSVNGQEMAVKWPIHKKEGEKVSLLEGIRETETPGKRGSEFVYAQAVYGCFGEIEELKAEGFTLATICKYLESKGVLPAGSDPRSFCRAFRRRREAARREQATLKERNKEMNISDTTKKTVTSKENTSKREISEASVRQEPKVSFVPAKPKSGKPGLQINPDNTFNIAPIDPDDLPDI